MSNRASYQHIDNIRIGSGLKRVATKQEQADIQAVIYRLQNAQKATNVNELRLALTLASRKLCFVNKSRSISV